ncbi:helix-turn-helix domain-containing protein [Pedobacter psychroterrae]|uniref:AraC family transcriptional regulator n=1 Tax=Pedobacter psychroterrae TaxID=2530453 RepID=A0A4V2MLS2_9SPHI|nr:AraC family transcriptional regulator [Pedobacter psychroterrae]TCD03137.1 AraC family transcriptional regulator [Pedobacter psychroterrae]
MKVFDSLSDFHRLLSISPPLHPLVSVVKVSELHTISSDIWKKFTTNFYTISLKNNIQSKIKYGQNYYDFDNGTMTFIAPKQIQSVEVQAANSFDETIGTGYVLMFHPDFLRKHPLASAINNYTFFSYEVNEALHLSEKEENSVIAIFKKIEEEYHHIDRHTQSVILSQIDLLLNYSNRFYERQFITRKAINDDLLTRTERLINQHFDNESGLHKGILTVEHLASELNLSANYLSDALRSLTGQSAQQHIQEKLIAKAKEYLTTTNLLVSEIANNLGFQRTQSFNKLFKNKTAMSPLEFRQSFN